VLLAAPFDTFLVPVHMLLFTIVILHSSSHILHARLWHDRPQVDSTVNVRTRDNVVHGMHKLEAVRDIIAGERDSRSLTCAFGSGEEAGSGGGAGENGSAAADS
jgi:hypothetical protein